ncbi:ABC transporter substrate-binding protein [Paenibacillus sp.]|uniref:ABC transporter substrate-binding protein n=1 Tax=Paenibacillus sp. TaxID=58172 RepID=UPI0028115183|nr:ABC transporter substrate-binding protein [Paenibacillus sp.]
MILKKWSIRTMALPILAAMLALSACSTGGDGGSKDEPSVVSDSGESGNGEQGKDAAEGPAVSPPGQYPIVAEKLKLKVFAPQYPSIEDMETNLYTKWIEEKTNIDLDFELAPNDALNERKQLMMASGDYPEVILHGNLTKEEQMKYGQQGVFLPLNDLIEKYAPNVKKAMEDIPYLKQSITAPDGNIYAIPQINECFHCTYAQKYWINEKWIEKVGLQMPTTPDELYTVLKAFKEKDPNGNGQADEIPLTGATLETMWEGNIDGYLMAPFIYNDGTKYLMVKDGKVELAANKDEWRQGLEYMNKLFSEGLIDKAAFTQNADAVSQLANRDPNVLGSITTALISYAYSPDDKHPVHKEYATVPPLKGPNGVQQAGYYGGVSNSQFAITNKASELQQAAAMRLVDLLFTEEAVARQEFGPKDEKWREAEAGELGLDGQPAKYARITSDQPAPPTHNDGWEQIGPSLRTAEYRASWAVPQDPLAEGGYELRLYLESKKYEPYKSTQVYPSSVFIDSKDASEAAQLQTNIASYVRSNMAQFITGSKDIEKEWDAYVKGFEGLNAARYLEIHQKAIDANQ